jgi:ribosomal protein L40E
MIVCPNCNHPNPDGAVQCEACYTPLPATTNCPSCGATVQADAAFCGQCGYNLRPPIATAVAATVAPDIPVEVPPLVPPEPLVPPQPVATAGGVNYASESAPLPPTAVMVPTPDLTATEPSSPPPPPEPPEPVTLEVASPPEEAAPPLETAPAEVEAPAEIEAPAEVEAPLEIVALEEAAPPPAPPAVSVARTQLQQITASLVHVQSDRLIELPQNLSVIHMGKPNDRIPPDVDVSGFPNSEIVSRIHADIRVEGDAHYIEDVGSSNGTYINNLPLLPGNRHRLRPGDRISLGKGDMVTFLFQLS